METQGTARLTGIQHAKGACENCGRELTVRVFQVAYPDGSVQSLGRRCAAKATGYKPNLVEREAARAARLAETARRRAIVLAAYPGLDPTIASKAACNDGWWGARLDPRCYGTWQDYVEAMLARKAS